MKSIRPSLFLCFIYALLHHGMLLSQNIIVTKCDTGHWSASTVGNPAPSFEYVNGISTPPLSEGSFKYTFPTLPQTPVNTYIRFRNVNYDKLRLTDLTKLSYSTYIEQNTGKGEAPYIRLEIDVNGDGTDTIPFLFTPKYQTGTFKADFTLPDPKQEVVLGNWQEWDALSGGWWVGPAPDPDNGGELTSIKNFVTKYPNARIINTKPGIGGISLQVGSVREFVSPWSNFIGYADKFSIGVAGSVNNITTTYDFEANLQHAGKDQQICRRSSTTIGAPAIAGHTYSWTSTNGFQSTEANPVVKPLSTTIYTLTETVDGCTMTDDVKITVTKGKGCKKNPGWNFYDWPRLYQVIFIIVICGLIWLGIRKLTKK